VRPLPPHPAPSTGKSGRRCFSFICRGNQAHDGDLPATALSGGCASKAAMVDPALQHKNRVAVLVDGPEIVVRTAGR
jgi:hypothetical protein